MVRIEQTSADAIYRGLTMLVLDDKISLKSRAEIMDEVFANMVKSKPEKFDLNNLQFYFFDGYDEESSQFGKDLMNYIKSGRLKAYWKDKSADSLKGEDVPMVTFDEMHEYPCGPLVKLEFEDDANKKSFIDKVFKVWNKEKSNLVYEPVLPIGATIKPEPAKRVVITEEDMVNHLKDIGYAVTKNSETKGQLDKMYNHKTNLFIKEPDEKDEYDAAMAEWRESFNAWKEKDSETDERINEIADKVNAVYGALKYLKPLIERIDSDQYIMKCGLGLKGVKPGEEKQANLNTTNTTVNYSGNKLTEEEKDMIVKQLQNDLAKSIREDRLRGGLK